MTRNDAARNDGVLKKYKQVFGGIKYYIKRIDDYDSEYEKDYTKIKFSSDDNVPLNKVLYFPTITVIIRCVFEKDGKYYPQVYLDKYLNQI